MKHFIFNFIFNSHACHNLNYSLVCPGQVSLCLRPSDVLLVTYNHMDAIRSFASDNPAISNQVENVYKLLYEVMAHVIILYAPACKLLKINDNQHSISKQNWFINYLLKLIIMPW